MSLILPCAGSSSRYPNMKPKWMLTLPSNKLMIQGSIEKLDLKNINDIYVTFLKEHIIDYELTDLEQLFHFTNKKVHILLLNDKTNSQPETVLETINHFNIEGPIFIKDCDNSFEFCIDVGNYICSLKIDEKNNVKKLYNKSFIQVNDLDEIINISEKNIISNEICIGGYSFSSTTLFIKLFNQIREIREINDSLFISRLIFQALLNKTIFKNKKVNNYHDWGTFEDWIEYKNNFRTLFIDIDGTLFINSSEYFKPKWGDSLPINENIKHIQELYKKGNIQIILTTSRKSEYRDKTIEQLNKYNVPYNNIIFDLFHSKRFLINDYSNTNPYPTSISINLKRDDNTLKDIL